MPSFIARLRAGLVRLWRTDAPLTAGALLMLGVLGACALGLWLDPRSVLGAPVWLKPAKFAASIAIYCLTLAWLFGYMPGQARTRRLVSWTTVGVLLFEMSIVGVQAARGTTSHFNVSSPLHTLLWALMGAAVLVQTLSTVAVAVALFRQRFADHALGWALRLGLVLTIAGALLGGLMTRPTEAQLDEMRAGRAQVSGAHTVGAPDGGPGVPVTGWSREHGDLRVAHFLGLHALQLLPLAALGLRRTRASEAQRSRLVFTLAGSHAGLVAILLWQALRGQPVLAPDASTLAVLVSWLMLSSASAWRSLARPALPRAGAFTLS
ncbi:MAG TPA: hypothetical protein VNN80_22845 [Polyangiaceae bacterium]|nr:hypothetical protein [Polyangiaceae bacterium]